MPLIPQTRALNPLYHDSTSKYDVGLPPYLYPKIFPVPSKSIPWTKPNSNTTPSSNPYHTFYTHPIKGSVCTFIHTYCHSIHYRLSAPPSSLLPPHFSHCRYPRFPIHQSITYTSNIQSQSTNQNPSQPYHHQPSPPKSEFYKKATITQIPFSLFPTKKKLKNSKNSKTKTPCLPSPCILPTYHVNKNPQNQALSHQNTSTQFLHDLDPHQAYPHPYPPPPAA